MISRLVKKKELPPVVYMLLKNKGAIFGLIFIVILVATAIFADFIAPYDPVAQNIPKKLAPPSFSSILGCDEFGRDVLSRLIYGSRISLIVGSSVVAISAIIGSLLGSVAGYYGGGVDMIIMRLVDIFISFPGLILAIGIMAALGQSILNVIIALSLVNWPAFARVVRAEALRISQLEYIQAAKVMGASNRHIIFSHIIPNSLPPILVLVTLNIGWAILAEASLSFLGLGVNPPEPSWGSMVAVGRFYLLQAQHVIIFPGLAIFITVLAFNLFGDGLRDALDPQLQL
jgi:ABC-type dipeptide/oligopeptide/nickel transport system permease subunit